MLLRGIFCVNTPLFTPLNAISCFIVIIHRVRKTFRTPPPPPLQYFNMSSKNELHKITINLEILTLKPGFSLTRLTKLIQLIFHTICKNVKFPFNVMDLACHCTIKYKKETECPQSRVCTDRDIDPSKSPVIKPRPLHRAGSPTVCVQPSTQSEVTFPKLEITHAVMTTTDDRLSFITMTIKDDRICYQHTRSMSSNRKLVCLLKS